MFPKRFCFQYLATFKSSQHADNSFTGYIGEFEEVDDHRSGKIVIQLNGRYVPIPPPHWKL